MFGRGRHADRELLVGKSATEIIVLQATVENHLRDCSAERERSTAWRAQFQEKMEANHRENRTSIAGIYRMLWAVVCLAVTGLLTALLGVLTWIAITFIPFRIPAP